METVTALVRSIFQKESLDDCSLEELQAMARQYSYFTPVQFLLAEKLKTTDENLYKEQLQKLSLHFNNPLWLNSQLENKEPEEVTQAPALPEQPKVEEESPIAFQSYHTIDYFASQGIRLQQAELSKDRLGQQLKSFTEWLRSMKKLPSAEGQPVGPEDLGRQQVVIQNAASSIEEKEVVTEAMAEVWLKQGNNPKAAEIYYKLSLLNPSKNAYFAAKIDQLK